MHLSSTPFFLVYFLAIFVSWHDIRGVQVGGGGGYGQVGGHGHNM